MRGARVLISVLLCHSSLALSMLRGAPTLLRGFLPLRCSNPLHVPSRCSSSSPLHSHGGLGGSRLVGVLTDSTEQIKGVGPKVAGNLSALGIYSIMDLLLHLPNAVIDRSKITTVQDNEVEARSHKGTIATILLRVTDIKDRSVPKRVCCVDQAGNAVSLVYFTGNSPMAFRMWSVEKAKFSAPGETFIVSGTLKYNQMNGEYQFVQPDIALPKRDAHKVVGIEPQYGGSTALKSKKLRELVSSAIAHVAGEANASHDPDKSPAYDEGNTLVADDLEWLETKTLEEKGWPPFLQAIKTVHSPADDNDLHPCSPAKERLAFDELLASQVLLAARRKVLSLVPSPVIQGDGSLIKQCAMALSYTLTLDQEHAIKEIVDDMANAESGNMRRLLQGDVGSGKTIVALFCMLRVVESGRQACLLAPTEVLVKQHLKSMREVCSQLKGSDGSAPSIKMLTSSIKGEERQKILERLRTGDIDILIGTHAVLEDSVIFKELGLAVIDEEQRFGVAQRSRLEQRNQAQAGGLCHVLYMTATPIPRTLTLAGSGDMSITSIHGKPKTAREVETVCIGLNSLDKVVGRIQSQYLEGPEKHKVFWVMPLVEESSRRGYLGDVQGRYEALCKAFGEDQVGMLHGRMSSAEKASVLESFNDPDGYKVLVATTIIEVGVDVPTAQVCVIENAEVFGLSQLHQMRGRVGRAISASTAQGDGLPCSCVLLYREDLSAEALKRLEVMCNISNGFLIAEADLKLRGPGEVLGARQQGYVNSFRVADLAYHDALLQEAHEVATRLISMATGSSAEEANEAKAGMDRLLSVMGCAGLEDLVSQGESALEFPLELSNLEAWRKERLAKSEKQRSGGTRRATRSQVKTTIKTNQSSAPSGSIYSSSDSSTAASGATGGSSQRSSRQRRTVDKLVDLTAADVAVVAFDLETTGLSPNTERILQIGAKVVGQQSSFRAYVDPQTPISAAAASITGITTETLRANRALPFADTWPRFSEWLQAISVVDGSGGVVLVAHNAAFDLSFLEAELERIGLSKSALGLSGVTVVVDSLKVLRDKSLWGERQPPNHRLVSLFEHTTGKKLVDAHDALVDAEALEVILQSLPDWKRIATMQGQFAVSSS